MRAVAYEVPEWAAGVETVTADGDVVSRTPLNVVCKSACLRVIGDRIVSTADGDAGDVISGGA